MSHTQKNGIFCGDTGEYIRNFELMLLHTEQKQQITLSVEEIRIILCELIYLRNKMETLEMKIK